MPAVYGALLGDGLWSSRPPAHQPPAIKAPLLPRPRLLETAWLDPASSLARHLMDGYERMGHTLALQYGERYNG